MKEFTPDEIYEMVSQIYRVHSLRDTIRQLSKTNEALTEIIIDKDRKNYYQGKADAYNNVLRILDDILLRRL